MTALNKYLEYHKNNALMWEIDTHLDAAVYFADKWGLDREQRCWFAFLNAICETTPTAIYLFKHFPDIRTTSPEELTLFAKQNKGAMAFQYDVRWILYEIESVVSAYKLLIRQGQYHTLSNMAYGGNANERCKSFVNNFRVPRFGPYTFMLYTELLYHICGIDIKPVLDPRTNHSVRSGIIFAGGFEDFMKCTKSGGVKPTEVEVELLNAVLEDIYKGVENLNINPRHKTVWAVETTLCTYNKTMHGRRYLGFYRNRQRKEIDRLQQYTKSIGENFDWSEVREYHNKWGEWNNNYKL